MTREADDELIALLGHGIVAFHRILKRYDHAVLDGNGRAGNAEAQESDHGDRVPLLCGSRNANREGGQPGRSGRKGANRLAGAVDERRNTWRNVPVFRCEQADSWILPGDRAIVSHAHGDGQRTFWVGDKPRRHLLPWGALGGVDRISYPVY
jgi:hypothetical protein